MPWNSIFDREVIHYPLPYCGGDRQYGIPEVLREKYGITKVVHWTGRKSLIGEPRNISLVVVVTGFVSHAAAKKAQAVAKRSAASIVYAGKAKKNSPAG